MTAVAVDQDASVIRMRCLVDGRWMRRLAPGGHWWMCSNGCKELRSSKPDVEFGWQLMAGRKMVPAT
jgi:hypothetical protein